MATITYLQLYVQHCRVEALVNDIVVQRQNEKDIVTFSRPVHPYLIDGENILALNVRPASGDAFDPTARVHLRIANFEEGDDLALDGGDLLSEIVFDVGQFQDCPSKLFFSQSSRFFLSSSEVWAWQKAGILALNDNTIASLNQFVELIHRGVQEKNPKNIIAASLLFMQDQATCYPAESVEMLRKKLITFISGQDGDRVRLLIPLDVKNMGYRLAAGGRLVECIGKDGLPLIRTETSDIDIPYNDDNYMGFPMHVGFLDDQFQKLR